MLFKVHINVI